MLQRTWTQERERYKISYINSRDLYIMEDENSVVIDVAKDYGTLAIERDSLSDADAEADDDADVPAFGD